MNKKFVIFKLNEEICASHVNDVSEIIELDNMVRTTSKALNVAVWNELALPVLDPIAMLSPFGEHKPTIRSRILVLRKRGMDFGILVEDVVGVMEIHRSEIEEPNLAEHRYVSGVYKNEIKIFEAEELLTQKLVEKFQTIYQMEIEYLLEGETVEGIKPYGRDALLESLRLRTLNWSIKATKRNIEDDFIMEALEIHNLAAKL